jgi:hypothetical protein
MRFQKNSTANYNDYYSNTGFALLPNVIIIEFNFEVILKYRIDFIEFVKQCSKTFPCEQIFHIKDQKGSTNDDKVQVGDYGSDDIFHIKFIRKVREVH